MAVYQINDSFHAFQRDYKRGDTLGENELVQWPDEHRATKVDELVSRGTIEALTVKTAPELYPATFGSAPAKPDSKT